jgi:hypothetical protein
VKLIWIERTAIAVASLALAVVLIALASGYFTGHDPGSVGGGPRIGETFLDQGNELIGRGALRPPYDSDPPTSGPHVPVPVRRDQAELSDDQMLQALSLGDVLFVYGTARPPAGLAALATKLAGRFRPSLAASGLAVVLAHVPGTSGVIALAWTRMLRLPALDATLLSDFTQDWLGRGAR